MKIFGALATSTAEQVDYDETHYVLVPLLGAERRYANRTRCEFLEPMFLFFDTKVFTWSRLLTIDSLKDPKRNAMEVNWVRSWTLVKAE